MNEYKDIIELIDKKDPKGLEVLYNNYGSKFYAYSINKWYLSEDEAWDVVYKTLETLVLKLPNYKFESKSRFEGFLFKVLVNFLRQDFRSKRSKNKHEIEFVNLNSEDEIPYYISKHIYKNAFTEYYKKELIESPALITFNDALNQLDQLDKDILLLRAQNYSYEEIATLLKVDNNQLKVKHHRAKQKLIGIINKNQ